MTKPLDPSVKAAKKARREISRVKASIDQAAYEAGLPPEVRSALEKGRYDVGEVLDVFGSDIDSDIDIRGSRANINSADDVLAIYPIDGESAYAPADFTDDDNTEAPTKTENPDRPRTVAASWDPSREVLTVVFRDSTIYNYYDVSKNTWDDFKTQSSKWKFIRDVLDSHPRGPAATSDLPPKMRHLAYRGARALQIKKNLK